METESRCENRDSDCSLTIWRFPFFFRVKNFLYSHSGFGAYSSWIIDFFIRFRRRNTHFQLNFPLTDWLIETRCKMKYVLVTGGVVSGLGKGVTASSIGVVLKACGLRVTSIKIGTSSFSVWDAGLLRFFVYWFFLPVFPLQWRWFRHRIVKFGMPVYSWRNGCWT